MHFKGSGTIFFAFLAFTFIVGIYAPNYATFLRQHYDNPKSRFGGNYCDAMMQSHDMTRPQCKEVNSFIHDTKNNINAICGNGGEPYGPNLRRSKRQFSVTTCKLKGGSNRPPCNYRDNMSNRYIVIACINGWPVHYDEGHI